MADTAEKNPIEILETQIQAEPEKITADTVIEAYNKEKKRIETGTYSPERKANLLVRLEEDKQLLLQELKVLKESRDIGKSRALQRSRQMRMQLLLESMPEDPRYKSFEAARKWALEKSDPENKANKIQDYEGTGIHDSFGRTRFLFSGYLAAMKRYDEANKSSHADLLNGLAEKAYDNSSVDSSVDESDLMLKLDTFSMKPYVDMLAQNGIAMEQADGDSSDKKLSPEMTGFFVGYLKLTDLHFKDAGQAEKYRQYLYGEIKSMLQSGLPDYNFHVDPSFQKKTGTFSDESDSDAALRSRVEKGKFQLRLFSKIKTPDEWQGELGKVEQMSMTAREHHKKFVDDAMSASRALDLKYQNPIIQQVLALDNSTVNLGHDPLIIAAETFAAKEAAAKFPDLMKKTFDRMTAVGARVQQLKEKTASSGQFDPKEFTDMQLRLAAAQKQLESLGVEDTTPLSTYVKHVSVVSVVSDELENTNSRLSDIEKGVGATVPVGGAPGKPGEKVPAGTDIYQSEWSKAQSVDGRFKNNKLVVSPNISEAAYRDDNGAIVGKMKGGTEVSLVDVNAKAKQINDTVFVKVKFEDKEIWVDQSQLELAVAPAISGGAKDTSPEAKEFDQFLVSHNLREFTEPGTGNIVYGLGEITDKPLNPDSPGIKSTGNYDVDRTLMQKYVGKKLSSSDAERLNVLLQQGIAASGLVFAKKPSMAELQSAYSSKFIPMWEYIGKYEKIPSGDVDVAPVAAPAEKFKPVIELGFLGTIYQEYADALLAMVTHGNDPDGASFNLRFNNGTLPCRLIQNGNQFEFRYPNGVFQYPNIQEAANALNKGFIHQRIMELTVGNELAYKDYVEQTGGVDEIYPKDKEPHKFYLEFDWNNPDPDIDIEVLPHGRILYTVGRENIGIYGEETRKGAAEDFDSFMRQMIHLKKWAEGTKHTAIETPETSKEITWQAISSYYSFRKPEMEKVIGRVVKMNIEFNEVVQVYLDWGGGNNPKHPDNVMVNMWVGNDGTIVYIVNGHGTSESGSALNFASLVSKLREYRGKPAAAPEGKKPDAADAAILSSIY
ncbi:hypothetical protein IT413_02560 [Candidatus Peregrinibacteria bacterium]|nr:hypothetical protein [Candidatus Peregrinibacteria bacterium]